MYDYGICSNYDIDIFHKQCRALESHIPNLEKQGDLYESVFGTLKQKYTLGSKALTVVCDEGLDDVHIESEFDIEPFFKK